MTKILAKHEAFFEVRWRCLSLQKKEKRDLSKHMVGQSELKGRFKSLRSAQHVQVFWGNELAKLNLKCHMSYLNYL